MKALVFRGVGELNVEEVEVPPCPPDGLLMEVKACGLCGSDLRTYRHGHRHVTPPWIVGHEVAGVVREVGPEVDGFHLGDRLAVAPPVYCGHCFFCRRGQYNLCRNIRELAQHWPGGFAEFMSIPREALAYGNVHHMPEGMSFEEGAVSEPPSSCINAQEQAQVALEETVVVMGAGPIGCFHLEIARARGAGQIILMDIQDRRLQLARRFAPDLVCNNARDDAQKLVMEATDGLGGDVVIVACPSPRAQADALGLARKGGRVIYFGGLPPGRSEATLDTNVIHYKALQVQGSTRCSPPHHRAALQLIAAHKIHADQYITHVVPLEEVERGIEAVEAGEALKVVMVPQE